jgi:hypothetical protein
MRGENLDKNYHRRKNGEKINADKKSIDQNAISSGNLKIITFPTQHV